MAIRQLALLLLILLVGVACIFKAQKIPSFLAATSFVETRAIVQSTTELASPRPTSQPSASEINNTKTVHHSQSRNHSKYLQYFVSGRWSNQLACLSSAYSIAWATNRTLILSPVVPFRHLHFRTVFDVKKSHTFFVDVDLRHLYRGLNLRLDQVLDVDFLNPPVPSIHFGDFYQHVYPTLHHPRTWVMETNYSHLNSIWIYRQPELLGTSKYIEAREYNIDFQYTVEARDLETVANDFSHYDIWTLLDSFQAMKHNPLPITFQPRFSPWIRQTAHRFIQDSLGGDKSDPTHMPHYASVHIRGSDGHFKKPDAIEGAINQTLDQITHSIVQWMAIQSNHTTTSNITTIGLFVATDIQGTLSSHPIFLQKIERLQQLLQGNPPPLHHHHHDNPKTLKLVFGSDLTKYLKQLYATAKQSSSFPFSDLDTPTIFLDQQIAACATIDFQGTNGSTFSNFIQLLRVHPSYSCST